MSDARWVLRLGESFDVLAELADESVDALVCDPPAGSGTTGVAAIACSLRFFGVEQQSEYHDIAARRIAEAAEGKP